MKIFSLKYDIIKIGESMQELFLTKLKNLEYISNLLYEQIKKYHPSIIPHSFNLDEFNNQILEKEYVLNKDYFDKMFENVDPNIRLDKEQIKAVLADEDYSLIIAGAGTGKTTTMTAKVKYLVEKKHINPSEILVMSFTKKATEELEKRIILDFGIPANVTTFHSLGLMYIREIFNDHKCYVIDENTKYQIFYDYFKKIIFPNKEKIEEILSSFSELKEQNIFLFGKHFIENYQSFETFEGYFEFYKKTKRSEIEDLNKTLKEMIDQKINSEEPTTIQGELVKSKGEAIIANFLYSNGIEYYYEKIYDELKKDRRSYKPDFTINVGGENIYIEYFGLSNYEDNKLNQYNKIKREKEHYHALHHNKFIKIDYMPNEDIIETLNKELQKLGVTMHPKSDEEIYNRLLDNNPAAQIFPFRNLLYSCIDAIKSSPNRENYQEVINKYLASLSPDLKKVRKTQYKYILEFYQFYQNYLYNQDDYGFDYPDMIYYANRYLMNTKASNKLKFKYIIIDEYQDISWNRYELTRKIALQNQAKVIAVGDDWQSIFAFAGSKIKYIYHFQEYYPGAKLFQITTTYRNSQELLEYSGNFIMKNEDQIKKKLISNKKEEFPIKFFQFEDEYEALKELILKIHKEHPTHKIMILARTNKQIERLLKTSEFKDEIDTKIELVGYEDIKIDGMTMHKSKGLTCDEVILIGLDRYFPHDQNNQYWIKNLFRNKEEEEKIAYAEERRVFYVALTRTKNKVYLLVNKNKKQISPFVYEIYQIIMNNNKVEQR